jgi:GATA-binding protein, other eukaryote
MSPIMLETPALYIHNSSLSSLSRMQPYSPSATDHINHDPPSTSPSVPHSDSVQKLHNEFTTYNSLPSPKDRLPADEFNFSSNEAPLSRLPCANCGVVDTPPWRRDTDGNSICNACGEFISYYFTPRSYTCLYLGGIFNHLISQRCLASTTHACYARFSRCSSMACTL